MAEEVFSDEPITRRHKFFSVVAVAAEIKTRAQHGRIVVENIAALFGKQNLSRLIVAIVAAVWSLSVRRDNFLAETFLRFSQRDRFNADCRHVIELFSPCR